MKNKKILFAGLLLVLGISMYGCSSEDDYAARQEKDRIDFQNKVLDLAQEYDIEVAFFESNSEPGDEDFKSLEEIEEIFEQIKKYKEKPQTFSLFKETTESGKTYYKTRKKDWPLVKTRSEIYGFSEWVFNLSWFSVTLIEDEGSCEVHTDFTGLSFYSYTQKYASASVNGNTISFNATGTLEAKITSKVGIKLAWTVIADGSYNKSENEGSVSLDCY